MTSSNQRNILTVSQLTHAIKQTIEPNFRQIYVQGEVSNFKKQMSGHLYFSLKDNGAQISAAYFKGNAKYLSKMPKDGDKVVVKGEISIYPPRGNYQIIVRELHFLGVGELLLKLHQLKEKLKTMGWFDSIHKKPLPHLPKRIGVVTSPTGAVIQDILNVLTRRFSGLHILLNPVKVQGDGAAEEISDAINDFNKYKLADVIIVGRGGGSLEDLFAFNEEVVAKSIFTSQIPVISAIGHETDTSIADYVADVRAPTPSAAAEIAVKEKLHFITSLQNYRISTKRALITKICHYQKVIVGYKKLPSISHPYHIIGKYIQQLDDFKQHYTTKYSHVIERKRNNFTSLKQRHKMLNPSVRMKLLRQHLLSLKNNLCTAITNKLSSHKEKYYAAAIPRKLGLYINNNLTSKNESLLKITSHLRSIDPANLLKKGYSILFNKKTHSIIHSINDIMLQDEIMVKVTDGTISAIVNKTEKNYDKR
jgi:exodeoxyribonuclease VII large subunit